MTTSNVRELLDTRDTIFEILIAQMNRRKSYKGLEWITAERQAMLDAVNQERSWRSLSPVTTADIERIERLALGTEYAQKCALYCARLAIGSGSGAGSADPRSKP